MSLELVICISQRKREREDDVKSVKQTLAIGDYFITRISA